MLQTMRDLGKSWLFKGLLLLLVASFGIWGVGDLFRGNPQQRAVAEVGPVKITVAELEQNFQASLPDARRVFGPELTAAQARELGLLDRSLNLLIESTLYEQEARRLGIMVSDAEAFRSFANRPELKDAKGIFRKDVWQQFLRQSGLTERTIIDNERRNMSRRIVLQTMTEGAGLPDLAIDNLYRARAQKRIVTMVTVARDAMPLPDAPDAATLQAYYNANQHKFAEPERRSLTIAQLSVTDLQKDIVVSDEDIAAAYDARAKDYEHPEQRDLIQVVLQDEAAARKLASAAKASKSLTTAAKAQGQETVALNRVDEASILPELYTTIFALKDGEIAEPVKSDLGWHVVQQTKTYPAGKVSLAEAKDKLRDTLKQEKAGDVFAQSANKLEDALAAGRSLEDLADSMKLRLVKTPPIDKTGQLANGKPPAELPAKETVLPAAFGLGSGEPSSVLDDRQGNYLIVRADDITPSQTPALDSIKPQVLTAWQDEARTKAAAEKAKQIAEALRAGKPASSFASDKGVSIRRSQPLSLLGDSDKAVPTASLGKIMGLKQGEVIADADTKDSYVFQLAELIDADPAKDVAGRGGVAEQLSARVPTEYIEQYSKALRTRFPVKIHDAVLNSLKQQEG